MVDARHPEPPAVEDLLRNAELRDELEPYYDESITRVNVEQFSVASENEFLALMLAWETAPILPVYRWFDPELRPPKPSSISDEDLPAILGEVIRKLYEQRIVLDFTDHLSDRDLYCLIYRDILPAREKRLENRASYLHWDCSHAGGDPDVWLRFYASDEDRESWAEQYHQPLPPRDVAPYPRRLPREPL